MEKNTFLLIESVREIADQHIVSTSRLEGLLVCERTSKRSAIIRSSARRQPRRGSYQPIISFRWTKLLILLLMKNARAQFNNTLLGTNLCRWQYANEPISSDLKKAPNGQMNFHGANWAPVQELLCNLRSAAALIGQGQERQERRMNNRENIDIFGWHWKAHKIILSILFYIPLSIHRTIQECLSHVYHGRTFPSYWTNPPFWLSFNVNRVLTICWQLFSISSGAFDPPISVLTQPGCNATHKILSLLKSIAIDFDAALIADFDIR